MSDQELRQKLHKAAFLGKDSKVQQMLESGQYKVNAKLADGETALHAAVIGGKISMCRLLLEFRADCDAQNKMGETPLHYASMNAMDEIVKLLLSNGADFTIMSQSGQFPLDLAGTDMTHHLLSQKELETEKASEDMMRLILRRPHHLLSAMSENLILDDSFTRAEKEVVSHAILHLFEWKNQAIGLIKWSIFQEVGQTIHEETLFRTDSFATRVMSGFTKLFGKDYLRSAITEPIRRLQASDEEYEIDPNKCPPEKMEENLIALLNVVKMFLDSILLSLKNCPVSVRKICAFLKQAVTIKFPKSRYIAVGGFIFLRFFSAAIMTPEAFGVIDNPPPPKKRRGLVLVAKIIQNLSNDQKFGEKEPYMLPVNPFLDANMGHFKNFLDQISTVPVGGSHTSSIPTWRFSVSRALFHVHQYLVVNLRGVGTHLQIDSDILEEKVRVLQSFTGKELAAMPRITDRSLVPENPDVVVKPDEEAAKSNAMLDEEMARSNEFQKSKDRVTDAIRGVLFDLQKLNRQVEQLRTFEEAIMAARLVKTVRTVLETPVEDLRGLNIPAMRVRRPAFKAESAQSALTEQKMEALKNASLGLFAPFNAHFRTLIEQLNASETGEVVSYIRGRSSIIKQLLEHYWGLDVDGGAEEELRETSAPERVARDMGRTIMVVKDQLRTLRDELEATSSIEISIAVAQLMRNTKKILSAPPGENFLMSRYEVPRPKHAAVVPKGNQVLVKKLVALRQMVDMLMREIERPLDEIVVLLEKGDWNDHHQKIVSRAAIISDLLEEFIAPDESLEFKVDDAKAKMQARKEMEQVFNELVKVLMERGKPREVSLAVTKSQSRM